MFKINKVTIYKKIFTLIIFSSLFFLSLYFSLYYYIAEQEEEVYSNSLTHFDNEVSSLIELNDQTNISNIIDMVYWDEFVYYIKNKNQHWFNENITSSVGTYNSDYLGIYDINGAYIRSASTKKITAKEFIPKEVFKLLDKKRQIKFHFKIPEGYVQIFGASVHPTSDIYEKVSKPAGYFFIVKLLDKEYFSGLEKINNSEIDFDNGNLEQSDDRIFVTRKLKDSNGIAIAKLVFSRPFDVSFNTTKNILLLLVIFYLISLIVYLYYSREWIYKPLSLITSILEKGDEQDMESLKHIPGEFRYIGTLFKKNNKQKILLEKAKAKAEENDHLKSSFLTNISHEIRTPMNAIIGFSDFLLNPDITESERREYSKIIHNSGKNLVSIIDDLIEMSKIDTNQITPNFSTVDVDICLHQIFKALKISIPNDKKIVLQFLPPQKYIGHIVTDEIKLKQILNNLIINAIKYTENGFVKFGYTVNATQSELEFFVEDSGMGIGNEQLAKIFDRFYRIENDFTIKAGGLGLGLAISKAYVKMLGGRIFVESKEGKGTIFKFTIPIQEAIFYETSAVTTDRLQKSNRKTILVAEDDNINFLLIQKMLASNKHTIIRAKDGQEAVDICTINPAIDLVLMDIKMPVLDGYQAFALIHKLRPDLAIIAQTAYSSQADEEKIKQSGFTDYISKPINKEKLFEILDKIVNRNP